MRRAEIPPLHRWLDSLPLQWTTIDQRPDPVDYVASGQADRADAFLDTSIGRGRMDIDANLQRVRGRNALRKKGTDDTAQHIAHPARGHSWVAGRYDPPMAIG